MKTFLPNERDITRKWLLIDAKGKVLGRLASEVAKILMGKHKPMFSRQIDTGDFVIVINAKNVKLTGDKLKSKVYYHHSGYPGGIKEMTADKMLVKKPEEVIRLAVKNMLPKNKISRQMFTKLIVYADGNHPHEAQKPEVVTLSE